MQNAILRKLYEIVLRIRVVEERLAALYPEQEMRCPVHFCIGQEAVAAGVCSALDKEDYVLSAHRSHGHYLAKGGDLGAMIAELYGKATGCTSGRGGSMHLVDLSVGFLGAAPIVASTVPIAVGVALGCQMQGKQRVSVVFMGDGATEEGVFHESINIAVLKQVPIVFVCENNLYSVYTPISARQPEGTEILERAKGHGIESFKGDGNDAVEVYGLTKAAVEKARSGGGPTFLEFSTYRWLEHCGPYYDNDLGYRTEEEFLHWKKLCPLKKLEDRIIVQGLLTAEQMKGLRNKFETEIAGAVEAAKQAPFPDPETLQDFVHFE